MDICESECVCDSGPMLKIAIDCFKKFALGHNPLSLSFRQFDL